MKSARWWLRLHVACVVVTIACGAFAGWVLGSFIATGNWWYLAGCLWQVFIGWWCYDAAKASHRQWRAARDAEQFDEWVAETQAMWLQRFKEDDP